MVQKQVPVGELTPPSAEIVSDVMSIFDGGALELRFEFDLDGVVYRSGVRFEKVRAHRYRAEGHCRPWHVDVYGIVAEVEDSDWVADLSVSEPAETWGGWVLRHFMLYIDSAGCFEVVAGSWGLLPAEPVR